MLLLPEWLVVSADQPPLHRHGVRVVGDRIDAVGSNGHLVLDHPHDEVVTLTDQVLAPGFVNAHTHLYGVLAHGIPLHAPPTGFSSFLEDYWWPQIEDRLDVDMIAAATAWGCAELLRSGVTSFYDILEAPNAIPDALSAQLHIVDAAGLRGRLSFEATERQSAANGQLGLEENSRLIAEARRRGGITGGLMCFHTTFTCSTDFILEAFGRATELDVLCHAHLNEGLHEPNWCLEHHGTRTVELYDSLGVLSDRFLASQCVQVSEHERQLLAEHGVRVSHMPLANCEVGGGIAPIPELVDAGVTVGLGSDGYVNDHFEVMRGAFLLHKARLLDPGVMPAARVMHLATEGAARAIGLDQVGRLEPGWAADLQVIDGRFPTPVAEHNLFDQLVLWRNHTHVHDVMVAGHWRVRHGEVLHVDLGVLRERLHTEARRLWASA